MDDQQQGKQRKTSFLRKLFNKITNKPIEPEEDNDDENEEAFEVIDNNVNLEHGEQVNQGENQEEDEDDVPNVNVGNELAQELRAAFELYSKGLESIPCKEIGYILRTLGQNPTEDEIIALICEAGCDWDGNFTCDDFLSVALTSVQSQMNRVDDVKAAFRAFDHNGDGSISRDELRDAMRRFGHTLSKEECDEMFQEADLNRDGIIDWNEFLEMMLPGHAHASPT